MDNQNIPQINPNVFEAMQGAIKFCNTVPTLIQTVVSSFESLNGLIDSIVNSIAAFSKYIDESEIIAKKKQISANQWGEFGWVCFLPTMKIIDINRNLINCPTSQEQADSIMLSQLSDDNVRSLVNDISERVKKFGGNSTTFDEAEKCYELGIYNSCCTNLFALIDSCVVIHQPIIEKKKRKLPIRAIEDASKDKAIDLFCSSLSVKAAICKFYQDGNDFRNENGLNRNFFAHGMNKYQSNKTDCLKLFVLLYNLCVLFDHKYLDFPTEDNCKEM